MTPRYLIVALLTSLLATGACSAVQAQSLEGAYARVHSNDGRSAHGTVEAVTDSSIVLVRGERRVEVRRADIQKVETSNGRTHGRSALVGARLGAMLGMMIGYTNAPECGNTIVCTQPLDATLTGAGIGMVAGGIMGAALAPRKWLAAPFEEVRITIAPVHGGTPGPVVSLRF